MYLFWWNLVSQTGNWVFCICIVELCKQTLFVCILIRKLVNLRIRFYSQELLFFMYDISLSDTDISYYRDIKTAWQILYFVLRNPFKTYAILTQFTTVNLYILFIHFHTLNLVENKIQLIVYYCIDLCYCVYMLFFCTWMSISSCECVFHILTC